MYSEIEPSFTSVGWNTSRRGVHLTRCGESNEQFAIRTGRKKVPHIYGKHHEEENKFVWVNMLTDFYVLYRITDYIFSQNCVCIPVQKL